MQDKHFNELLASIHEAGKIHRGKKSASRSFTLAKPYIKAIRERQKNRFE